MERALDIASRSRAGRTVIRALSRLGVQPGRLDAALSREVRAAWAANRARYLAGK